MYGKIFASLYQGTLRGNAHAILVFTNLIACSDRLGNVDKHPRAIADEVGLTVDEVRDAIAFLCAPDPESRTPTEDGRRLLPLEPGRSWGWRITTHAKYRAMVREEERREQWRASQARVRKVLTHVDSHQAVLTHVDGVMTHDDADDNCQLSAMSTHAEADAEANTDAEATASIVVPEKSRASTQAVAVTPDFMDGMQEAPSVTRMCDRRTFADWRTMVAHRIFWTREEDEVWKGVFAAEGWDEMTKGYQFLAKKHPPPKKIFLSMFQEIRE